MHTDCCEESCGKNSYMVIVLEYVWRNVKHVRNWNTITLKMYNLLRVCKIWTLFFEFISATLDLNSVSLLYKNSLVPANCHTSHSTTFFFYYTQINSMEENYKNKKNTFYWNNDQNEKYMHKESNKLIWVNFYWSTQYELV